MSAPRFSRLQKAAALLPLAMLSAAWTASVAGVGVSPAAVVSAPVPGATALPDGTSVPTQAIEAPASVSTGNVIAPGLEGLSSGKIVAASSTSAIPSAALAAYQRAETVINAADVTCHLPWQLVAAIGRVESNHGRFGGNSLDDQGVATPGIYGLPLDGTNNTSLIADTDAGQYDNDPAYDRAVGPMQFIPSTWSVVGVDADGDGQRNPQDIDDAALATAVYLCSGADDLATEAGQRAAVYRYNHSSSYVDLVISIMQAYLAGDFTSMPNSTTAAGTFVPDPDTQVSADGPKQPGPRDVDPGKTKDTTDNSSSDDTSDGGGSTGGGNTGGGNTGGGDTGGGNTGGGSTGGGNTGGGNTGGGNTGGGSTGGGGTGGIIPDITLPPVPTTSVAPVDQVLTLAQATVQCTLDGLSSVLNPQQFQTCLNGYMNP